MTDSKYLKAILEYDAARIEIERIKKPLAEYLCGCDFEPYVKGSNNCIILMHRYSMWEKYSGYEYSSYYEVDEPEYREPCDCCKKALVIFDELRPARKRFGIAKVRLSRLARDYRNSFQLTTGE